MKSLQKTLGIGLVLLALLVTTGCCGWSPCRWWEEGGASCAPCGDPCDPCDTR